MTQASNSPRRPNEGKSTVNIEEIVHELEGIERRRRSRRKAAATLGGVAAALLLVGSAAIIVSGGGGGSDRGLASIETNGDAAPSAVREAPEGSAGAGDGPAGANPPLGPLDQPTASATGNNGTAGAGTPITVNLPTLSTTTVVLTPTGSSTGFDGGFGVEVDAKLSVCRRHPGESAHQGAKIHHGAADQQRHAAGTPGGAYFFGGIADEIAGGIALLRIPYVDESMRVAAQRLGIRLCRSDIHSAVYERRVHADDVNGKSVGKSESKVCLARCRRAHQADRWRIGGHAKRPYCPRRNSLSRSARLTVVQVGRP